MALTTKKLLQQIDSLSISAAVARGLRIAEATGALDIANWCRLELAGYWASNPAMNEQVVVPEYRRELEGTEFRTQGFVKVWKRDRRITRIRR